MPDDVPMPEIWLLGSSDFSARAFRAAGPALRLRAPHPAPGPRSQHCACTASNFRPSEYLEEPEALIGVSVVCAETEARAEELAAPLELTLLRFRSGKMGRFPTIEEATDYPYSPEEREIMEMNRDRSFVGSPAPVRDQFTQLADQAGVDEIMITTMTHDHADRRRSYELLAEAFALT